MEWTDQGVILSVRGHGETAAIVMLLTEAHGRHAGLVHGGASRAKRSQLQSGAFVSATWRARLADQLGVLSIEPTRHAAAAILDDAERLAVLASLCAVAEAVLPEREPHAGVFHGACAVLDALPGPVFAAAYVRWELGLLAELGYGLDLTACAATGGTDDLAYVSPRSGRAVSRAAGAPYADRLWPLPGFLVGGRDIDHPSIEDGLTLTGRAMEHRLNIALPPARQRLVERFRAATKSSSLRPS